MTAIVEFIVETRAKWTRFFKPGRFSKFWQNFDGSKMGQLDVSFVNLFMCVCEKKNKKGIVKILNNTTVKSTSVYKIPAMIYSM